MIKLRWYQKKVAPLLFDYWRKSPQKHPIVAIPTGAGKTIIIADVIHQVYEKWNVKSLIISHRKEILQQNYDALASYLKQMGCNVNIGMYSAGLGQREKENITVAGINSIYRKPELFEDVKLIIIDEAHLIPPKARGETMYQKFLTKLPDAKCFGLTATPYRLGSGYIVGDGHIFDDIVFDLTSLNAFNTLVKEGYLTKLVSKATQIELDAEGTRIIAGDYSEKELSEKFDKQTITEAAINEIVKKGKNYKKWLIFAIDIKHAENICYALHNHNINAIPVHSKMELDRSPVIEAFKKGTIRALVNVNILTVGIDVPDIDLIAFLRPTQSPTLYVQSAGRGLRVAPGKDHCLVLDFAKNVSRLGPINNVIVRKASRGRKGKGLSPTKVCPDCDTIVSVSTRVCPECDYKFPMQNKITRFSSDSDIVVETSDRWYDVTDVFYNIHVKINSPKSLKVTYLCGIKKFTEWVHLEHTGYAKYKANHWIKYRTKTNVDIIQNAINNADEMIKVSHHLNRPRRIKVNELNRYPEIIDYEF